jgi:glycosyltransferase involved in cell wall biosynthesis
VEQEIQAALEEAAGMRWPMKTCAVVPCYNVGSLCVPVIEQTQKYVDRVIAIDDGSTDDTASHLAATAAEILTHKKNAGKGAALLTAFRHILTEPQCKDYQLIITIDGDGQHNPEEIDALLNKCSADPNCIVVGTREVNRPDIALRRRLGNILSRYFISKVCGQYIPDTQSGFRVFPRELLRKILPRLQPGRYEMETAFLILAARAGYKIVSHEISTIYTEDSNRVSSFNPYLDTYLVFKVVLKSILFGR